ncbi:MAG: NAAT family transporter [Bacteroidetes bacterium]|nr:NAAT family transporter [Bacteroidota bacterium]
MFAKELFTFGMLVVTSYLTLINPFGVMPIYLTATADLDVKAREKTAKKATLIAFIIMLVFAFSGQLLFKFFGISVGGFKIAGGIIFLLMGMDMLQARLSRTKVKDSEVKTYVNDVSITPLAIPLLSGPGALTNSIILMQEATTIEMKIVFVIGLALTMALTCLILISASKLIKIIGETGMNVMMRLMGMIVMVIAVEFFTSGVKDIFNL